MPRRTVKLINGDPDLLRGPQRRWIVFLAPHIGVLLWPHSKDTALNAENDNVPRRSTEDLAYAKKSHLRIAPELPDIDPCGLRQGGGRQQEPRASPLKERLMKGRPVSP